MGFEDTFRKIKVKDMLKANSIVAGTETVSTSGAALSTLVAFSRITSSSTVGPMPVTLADGVEGQLKVIKAEFTAGSGSKVTPADFQDGTTITFTANKQSAVLLFANSVWQVVYTNGTVA